jgi:protocatechuate 3,4-dioxygenase beta subunit
MNERSLTRRGLLAAAGALAATAGWPRPLSAQALVPTPAQTTGPFYPVTIPADADSDLVVVAGRAPYRGGEIVDLGGRVLDRGGGALGGATIEIWQCDARGYYHHPNDRGGQADPAFQGFGRALADADGRYAFRTIKPVAYSGRAPHIHVRVLAPGRRPFVTQLYVAGDAANERDALCARARREAPGATIAVDFDPTPGSAHRRAMFDIVLA